MPAYSWRDIAKALYRLGYKLVRQRGSHMLFKNEQGNLVVVPRVREMKEGTLHSILDQIDKTKRELDELI